MIWYLLTAISFHLVAEVSTLVQQRKRDNDIPKEKQYTKQYKNTEHTKQKAKHKKQRKQTKRIIKTYNE
jgi:hypothetical protein